MAKSISNKHQRKAETEAVFLRPLRQRPAANRFDPIEQKVTAIEQRYREQVQETNRHRKKRDKPQDRREARGCDLAATWAIRIGPPS